MRDSTLQRQGDLIHMFFKVTTEPFDGLHWDGEELHLLVEFRYYRNVDAYLQHVGETRR